MDQGADLPMGFDPDSLPGGDSAEATALGVASRWVGGPIHGVGIGRTDDDRSCVVVFAEPGHSRQSLSESLPEGLPETIEGLPVVVRGSTAIAAQEEPPGDSTRSTGTDGTAG